MLVDAVPLAMVSVAMPFTGLLRYRGARFSGKRMDHCWYLQDARKYMWTAEGKTSEAGIRIGVGWEDER